MRMTHITVGLPWYSSKMKMEWKEHTYNVFLKCQVEALRCVVHVSVFEWHRFELILVVATQLPEGTEQCDIKLS